MSSSYELPSIPDHNFYGIEDPPDRDRSNQGHQSRLVKADGQADITMP